MESLLFCVFDSTIVNLPTYRQFTNAAWDWIIQKKERKKKKQKRKEIKIALSLGYPILFLQQKM